ncbi:hypothetical protein JHK85_025737 [Glycine max]|nr:hypothetical protein JHK85_025737 [Glycine max]KAG5012976.1 hypothetical protein JHK86_025237 [Glycine max]
MELLFQVILVYFGNEVRKLPIFIELQRVLIKSSIPIHSAGEKKNHIFNESSKLLLWTNIEISHKCISNNDPLPSLPANNNSYSQGNQVVGIMLVGRDVPWKTNYA